MKAKFKYDALPTSAETSLEEDRIVVDLVAANDPVGDLTLMERHSRTQLSLQTVSSALDVLRPPRGVYVHYIPQFYLH